MATFTRHGSLCARHGKPLREAVAEAQNAIAALDQEVLALEDQRDEQARAIRHLAEGKNPNYEEAMKGLVASLARLDVATLLREARATATPEDDAIVAQIDDARRLKTDIGQSGRPTVCATGGGLTGVPKC